MEIIQLTDIHPEQIAQELRNGKTIVYPTETCYGLGCDATNQDAVDNIYAIKQRQKDKPLLVVMPSIEMAREYVVWSKTINALATRYWPGPLTVVAQVQERGELASGVIAADNTIAFRITEYPVAAELSSIVKKPLVSTSANISTLASPYDIKDVVEMFSNADVRPDIIIDAGPLYHKAPSTIVKTDGDSFEILRQGELIVTLDL